MDSLGCGITWRAGKPKIAVRGEPGTAVVTPLPSYEEGDGFNFFWRASVAQRLQRASYLFVLERQKNIITAHYDKNDCVYSLPVMSRINK